MYRFIYTHFLAYSSVSNLNVVFTVISLHFSHVLFKTSDKIPAMRPVPPWGVPRFAHLAHVLGWLQTHSVMAFCVPLSLFLTLPTPLGFTHWACLSLPFPRSSH